MRSNADIVRESILAQNSGEDEKMLAALDPECVFHSADQPELRGRDAVRGALEAARRDFGGLRITLHEIEERGDAVLVVGSISAEKGMNVPRAWIWHLRGGCAYRVDSFPGREQALHAWRQLGDA